MMESLRSHGELYGRLLVDQQHNIPVNNSPTLSFPLGTSLVVIIIVFITAVFSFCYHWQKLRRDALDSLQQHPRVLQIISEIDSPKKQPPTKLEMVACLPVVYMPGDEMPKFIALPCPRLDAAASVSDPAVIGDGKDKSMGTEAAMVSKPSA